MQLFIKIENKGEVDKLAFHLLGASTKRQDNAKIGFFGSGNKYAIALLLRKNIFFKIYSGTQEIKFGKKPVKFRDDKYEIITINGKQTSMTTDMGPTWEDWFIIREFYCNALDEGDAKISVTDEITPEAGKTTIFIEKTEVLSAFFSQVDKYLIVTDRDVLDTVDSVHGKVSILPAFENEFILYRKGIRVVPEIKQKSLYRYNCENIQINESRVVEYEYQIGERIAFFFANTSNEKYIRNYLENWKGTYEEGARWDYVYSNLNPVWETVLQGRRVYPEKYALHSGDFEGKFNGLIVPNALAQKIANQFPNITVVGFSKQDKYKVLEPTSIEAEAIKTAQDALTGYGYPIQCKIVVATFYEKDVVAQYDRNQDQIVMSREHFNTNQSELQNTMLEEYFHSKGQVDGQRTFVTFLINELLDAKRYGRKANN